MGHPLAGCWEKMQRAREHVVAIEEAITGWMENNTAIVTCDPGGKALQHTWHAAFPSSPPKLRWGILIGDLLHNLRSTLDHLAWQLAAKHGNPPRYTAFPICRTEADYNRTTRSGVLDRGSGLFKMEGIRDARARAAITYCQPYHGGRNPDEHPLWALKVLSDADKHRVVQPMLMQTSRVAVPYRFLTAPPPGTVTIAVNHDPLEDESAIARITSTEAVIEAGDDYDVVIEPLLEISDAAPLVNAVGCPHALVDHVNWMLTQFQEDFFAPPD